MTLFEPFPDIVTPVDPFEDLVEQAEEFTRLSIQARFEAFHDANPWVYDRLVKMARQLHDLGRARIGIGMLFEVLRWQWQLQTHDPTSDFKLNNNYRSRYARRIMANEPDLVGIFETRSLHA